MRTYSLFVGEIVSDRLTIAFPPHVRNALETECRAAWRELNLVDPAADSASPFVPYNVLMQSQEGKLHFELLETLFYVAGTIESLPRKTYARGISLAEYNQLVSRIQAQRFQTQGRKKLIASRGASSADYRKFRSWWVSKHMAEALNVEFNEPCPFEKYTPAGETVSIIDMGKHFEEWTGHKIPKEKWAELKAREAERQAREAERQAREAKHDTLQAA